MNSKTKTLIGFAKFLVNHFREFAKFEQNFAKGFQKIWVEKS